MSICNNTNTYNLEPFSKDSTFVCDCGHVWVHMPRPHMGCFVAGHWRVGSVSCTLGSGADGDGVSWRGIWTSWLCSQADCGQLRVQMRPQLCYRQKAQGNPCTDHTPRARVGAPNRCPYGLYETRFALVTII